MDAGATILGMAPAPEHYRATPEQLEQLQTDIAIVKEKLQSIAVLMRATHGDADQRTIRAEETVGAFERFMRESERVSDGEA